MRRQILYLLFLVPVVSGAQNSIDFGKAPERPTIFEQGGINTSLSERDYALSPDGSEIFYTVQSPLGQFQSIVYRRKDEKGQWSKAELASFAGRYSDLEPAFSPDGKKLYFSSNRPLEQGDAKDFDIWVVDREGKGWGAARNLGSPVNGAGNEFYPAVASNGNLYFTAAYSNAIGKEDIYVSKFEGGAYQAPQPMDSAVNSTTFEFNAYVSPAEDLVIFTSYGRKDDKGRGDLYISIKDDQGKWLPARNFSAINSESMDYCPFVTFDGKILFFTSERNDIKRSYPANVRLADLVKTYTSPLNGGGNIYWLRLDEGWKKRIFDLP